MAQFELVIPAYNESKNLEAIVRRAIQAARARGLSANDFKLIVVENGSTDDSQAVLGRLRKLADLSEWFRVVNVKVNQGYGFGLWSGLSSTEAPFVGWTHADQQCDPDDALKAFAMLQSLTPKTLVKGKRFNRSRKDRFVSRTFEFLARLILGIKVHEMNAQPKVFSRSLLDSLRNPPRTFAFDLYVLFRALKSGFKIETIDVAFPPRIHGVSHWAANFFSRYKTIWGIIRYMLSLRKAEGRG